MGSDLAMMVRGMVLGKVISEVLGDRTPIHDVVSLADTILYPIEAHVHGFGLRWRVVPLVMPVAQELSVWIGVAGCLRTISSKATRKGAASLAL